MDQAKAVVRVESEGDIAVVVIDNPPINATSLAVRQQLIEAIETAAGDDAVRGLVIIGAGATFVAGADLREFGKPLVEPHLPTVIAAIETCGKPVVAALHGAALGGGLELALACDARVALAGTVVGLPEVTLGIIPGAGGTQRLPRLVGIPKAISLVAGGERIGADVALSLGIVDAVAAADLRAAAVSRARSLEGRKSRVRDMPAPGLDAAAGEAAEAALKAGKRRPAVRAAIEAVTSTATLSFDEGLERERAAFKVLRDSREAHALRHLFFAEREAAKMPELEGVRPRSVRKIAVIGAGTMGTGIAIAALDAGFELVLLDPNGGALGAGVRRVRDYYDGRVKAGKLGVTEARRRMARLRPGFHWSIVRDADLVIEAVFEDLAVKQGVFRMLDAVTRPDAVLATNTSYLDIDAIAAATSRPGDVVGLHFFSPANVMRLFEVVRGAATAPDVLATGLELGRRLRKAPVVSANAFGFIGNRVYAAYRRQCEFMLEDGASPQSIDKALEAFGFAMGPFAVGDLSGLDIAWRMRQSLAATRDPTARYVRIPDVLCEAGRFGRKTGAGYYRYDGGGGRQSDPEVARIIDAARAEKGIVPRGLGDDEIVNRVLLAMANEAALLLEQGVAQRAGDIDVALINGYGFPKWEGGPAFWARERGPDALRKDIDWLADVSGPGFVRGDARYLFPSDPKDERRSGAAEPRTA